MVEQGSYAALIGDIKASREADDRAALQQRFEAAVDQSNSTAAAGLASSLVITTGDEVQGLFASGQAVVLALVALADAMAPVGMRFGLGVGGLETPLRQEAIGMDGPCFHRAREALEAAEHRERWGVARADDVALAEGASGILSLMGAVRAGWTERQWEFIRAVRRADTQKQVAQGFDVSPSVVSESLKAASFREHTDGELALTFIVDRLLEQGHGYAREVDR